MKRMFFAVAALFLWAAQGQAEIGKKVWIDVSEAGSTVTIKVVSHFKEATGGTYQLEVTKAGPSGRSVSRQSGMVSRPESAKQQTSSISQVSVEPGATLDVLLTVKDDEGHVYKDSFSKAY
jgi:hypothetical protein